MSVITSQMVDSMSRKGDSIKVGETWYKAWDPVKAGLDKVSRGDTVSFTYTTKDTPTGTFYNIKGGVEVEAHGSGGSSSYATTAKTTVRKGFPIDPLDGQRSIIRQNCLNHATRVVIDGSSAASVNKMNGNNLATVIIGIARLFEAYATGDLDYEEAKKKAEETLSKEDAFANAA